MTPREKRIAAAALALGLAGGVGGTVAVGDETGASNAERGEVAAATRSGIVDDLDNLAMVEGRVAIRKIDSAGRVADLTAYTPQYIANALSDCEPHKADNYANRQRCRRWAAMGVFYESQTGKTMPEAAPDVEPGD
jgi:hypothetical protein